MARLSNSDRQRFLTSDLVLQVSSHVDPAHWDEDRYEAFLTALCGTRTYQREAISLALRYLLGGEYSGLRALAWENFKDNPALGERYGSWERMQNRLSFPDKLSGTLDLATGTGKSFVMYGIAAIMLAEGVVDRVLLLCPSRTIENGLIEKFRALAAQPDLTTLLPPDSCVTNPSIIRADETIVEGSICIENYHATLERVGSSIRDSLSGKGARTLVLNDEAHHVANAPQKEAGKWQSFLSDEEFGFRFILGVTGTAYVGNEYFPDVLFRYSLKQALEERFVKKIEYVVEEAKVRDDGERWQLIHNHHVEARKRLANRGLLPLTIVVTKDIKTAEKVAEELRAFLREAENWDEDTASRNVLCVHSKSLDVARLPTVDLPASKVEWIVSVAMLSEGWDVKRVFGIVPHEEKAFNSKLLIAQVLGRALRIPDGWGSEVPTATIWNHDKWAAGIRHLVEEILEQEKRLASRVVEDSPFHFDLHQLEYDVEQTRVEKPAPAKPLAELEKGYIDLHSEAALEKVAMTTEDVTSGKQARWQTEIRRRTYSTHEVAQTMFERLLEHGLFYDYTTEWPLERLEKIVADSLERVGMSEATESVRQRCLKAMGSLRRSPTKAARLASSDGKFHVISTRTRRAEYVNASQLRSGSAKVAFHTAGSEDTLDADEKAFYQEALESDNAYRLSLVPNRHLFKTPMGFVFADSEPERVFLRGLFGKDNAPHLKAWLKSTSSGFYSVKYQWTKRGVQKLSNFNPDFFLQVRDDLICVVEIKAENEVKEPSEENFHKLRFAREHFEKINAHLEHLGEPLRYHFNFLTPADFGSFFTFLSAGKIEQFQSSLDSVLLAAETD
jgi:type III restriction enzyme